MTDKRDLKRTYLQTKSRAGVYAIRNRVTGRALVAGGAHVEGILNRHRFELRQGVHRNARLTGDWSTHGETSFLFEVLGTVDFRDDPSFNLTQELEELVLLWRQEIACCGEHGYSDQSSASR